MNINYAEKFRDDLEEGEGKEYILANFLKKRGKKDVRVTQGYFKYYDIWADGVTYEVKYDKMAEKTGNAFFETECNGKPSGLSTTKADWIVYCFGPVYKFIFVKELKQWIEKYKHFADIQEKINAGDMGRVKGYTIKKVFLNRSYFINLHEVYIEDE